MQNQQNEFRPLSEYGLTPEDLVGAVALLYKRVSGDEQEFNTSLETQEEYGRALAAYLHVPIPIPAEHGVFEDVFTGTLYRERKGLTALREEYIRLSKAGYKVIVIVYCLDRLSRDQVHFSVLIDEMQHYNVKIASVKEKFDDSPLGRVSRAVLSFASELEHEKILGRTYDGKLARVQREKRMMPGPKPTYGYKWDDLKEKNRYVVDEVEAKIVVYIFEQYANGVSMREIAKRLIAQGVPAPRSTWQQQTIQRILTNKRYLGIARSLYTTRTLKDIIAHRGLKLKSEEDSVLLPDGTIPRLISDDLFEQVQRRIAANVQDSPRNSEQEIASLLRSGFVICGYCGGSMRVARKVTNITLVSGNKKGYVQFYYRCSNRERVANTCMGGAVSVSLLDTTIWEELKELAEDTVLIEAAIKQALGENSFKSEAQALERSIKKKEEAIEQFKEDLNNPSLKGPGRDVVLELLSDAKQSLIKLQGELAEVKRGEIDHKQIEAKYIELLEWCKKVRIEGDEMPLMRKRDFLRLLGVTVKVYREDDLEHERHEMGLKLPTIATGMP